MLHVLHVYEVLMCVDKSDIKGSNACIYCGVLYLFYFIPFYYLLLSLVFTVDVLYGKCLAHTYLCAVVTSQNNPRIYFSMFEL